MSKLQQQRKSSAGGLLTSLANDSTDTMTTTDGTTCKYDSRPLRVSRAMELDDKRGSCVSKASGATRGH